jgi:hypothetical protein
MASVTILYTYFQAALSVGSMILIKSTLFLSFSKNENKIKECRGPSCCILGIEFMLIIKHFYSHYSLVTIFFYSH